MPTLILTTQIHAPIERVFDLARSIDAHMATTTGTNEHAIAGRTTGLIEPGETVTWQATHLGITQRMTVEITSFERPHSFGDRMLSGAFAAMHHTHRFAPNNEGTLMTDEFHFSAPLGIFGRLAELLFLTRYMRTFLLQRGLALKRLAESDEWQRYLPATVE